MAKPRLSRWIPLTYDETKRAPATPGVYQIRCRGKAIPRMLGVDEEGILTIGESVSIQRRLGLFLYSAEGKKGGHAAGWRFNFLQLVNKGFPIDSLEFRWAHAPDKKAAYSMEGCLLADYLGRFGELPPLNYKANWSCDN